MILVETYVAFAQIGDFIFDSQLNHGCLIENLESMAHQSEQGRAFRLAAACTECQRRKQKASHYYDYQSEV